MSSSPTSIEDADKFGNMHTPTGVRESRVSSLLPWVLISIVFVVLVLLINGLNRASYEQYARIAVEMRNRSMTPVGISDSFAVEPYNGMVLANQLNGFVFEREEMDGYGGILIRLLESSPLLSDFEYELRAMPLNRILAEIPFRKQLVLLGGAVRDNGLNYSEQALLEVPYYLYGKSDKNIQYKDLNSLDTWKLGVVEGQSYGAELDQYIEERRSWEDSKLYFVRGEDANSRLLDALFLDRVDVIWASPYVLKWSEHVVDLYEREMGDLEEIEIGKTALYLAYSKQAPRSIREFVATVDEWVATDEAKRIRSSYLQEIDLGELE